MYLGEIRLVFLLGLTLFAQLHSATDNAEDITLVQFFMLINFPMCLLCLLLLIYCNYHI